MIKFSKILMMALSLLLTVAISSCSGSGESKTDKENPMVKGETSDATEQKVNYLLEPKTFQSQIANDENAVLIDVRTQGEIDKGYISNMINIDFKSDEFKSKIGSLDKSKNYYVYCAVGGRSNAARELMNAAGIKNVYDLKGGFNAWKSEGLEVSK